MVIRTLMRFRMVVEDSFGPDFITRLFKKKVNEGLLVGRLVGVTPCLIGNKLRRKVNAAFLDVERVIILMDADGQPLDQQTKKIKQYLDDRHLDCISIILLDYEIEEWICYSQGIPIKNEKPSKILKIRQNYQKNHLPKFAERIDCKKLASCPSFRRLAYALEST